MAKKNTNTNGSETSFANTPQAADDLFIWTEDELAASGSVEEAGVVLNLLANDKGGNAKSFYSLDDGNGDPLAPDFDLLASDVAGNVSPWELTSEGNLIRINNGNVEFKLEGSLAAFGIDSIDGLGANDQILDEFVYAIQLGNGTLSQARVSIVINGNNDAPEIGQGGDAAAIAEDESTITGQLAAVDADHDAILTWTVVGSAIGAYGSIAVNESGQWTYTLDNASSAVQVLAAGESHDEQFTIQVTDEHGAATSREVTVTVTGTNDAPVISYEDGADAGAVDEDGQVTASGQLTASDVDNDAVLTWDVVGEANGTYGSMAVVDGQWTYTVDNDSAAVQSLAEGASHDETFVIQVADETGVAAAQDVTITVTGTNDLPVIDAGGDDGTVKEEDQLTATGQLTATDIDANATQTWTLVGSLSGTYGSIAVDEATGQWTYTLDNESAAVQTLAEGESHDETFTMRVADEHGASATQDVTVTVTGNNDAPSLTTDAYRVTQGSSAVLDVLTNDTDIDGDALSIVDVRDSRLGTVEVAADGQGLLYTPSASGVDFVQYTVSDGAGGTGVATAVILVGAEGGTAGTVVGGSGDDIIDQSASTEDLLIIGGPGADQIISGSGNDLVMWSAGDGDDTIDGGDGFDQVAVALSSTQPNTVQVTEVDGNVVVTGPDFTLTIDGVEELSFVGGHAGDTITLDDLSNTDIADDTVIVQGGAGDDSVSGGPFFPRALNLSGNGGNDTLDGGLKSDLIDGGDGNDVLSGSFGGDTLRGGDGNDTLNGDEDADNLAGGAGDDLLDGGAGGDVVAGDSGNDTLIFDVNDGRLDGGSDRDTVRINGGGVALNLGAPDAPTLQNIEVIDLTGAGANTLRLDASTVIAATDSSNTLRVLGNAGDSVFAYGAWVRGSDVTEGSVTFHTYTSGGATLEIQDGVSATVPQQILSPGQLLEQLKPQTGGVVTQQTVTLAASQVDPDAYVSANGEMIGNLLSGGDHPLPYYEQPSIPTDKLFAEFGLPADSRAAPLVDTLLNGPPPATESIAAIVLRRTGTDITGNPVYQLANQAEQAAGGDTLGNVQTALFLAAWADELIYDATRPVPGESITWTQRPNGYDVVGTSNGENILTTSGDLTGNDTIDGRGGNDWIAGGPGHDVAGGGEGNDTVTGGAGDDYLAGSSGNDLLQGGDGDDRLDGGPGTNQLEGGAGNDTLEGGSGADGMIGGTGDDVISSGGGIDYVHGGAGNDTLDGGDGNDDILGGFGNDVLWGGDGNDTLYGDELTEQSPDGPVDKSDGNDVLNGGGGNDLLIGGGGSDGMFGWGGDDTLDGTDARYAPDGTEFTANANDVMSGGPGHDTYIVSSTDDIVLEGIWVDANNDGIQVEEEVRGIEREGFNLGTGGYAAEAMGARGNPWYLVHHGATSPYLDFDLARLSTDSLGGYIKSPVMQLNSAARSETATLKFEYYVDKGTSDLRATVEVWNGTSWIKVADNEGTMGIEQLSGSGWQDAEISIDLSTFSDISAFQFRFGASSNTASTHGGFLIDDVEFEAVGGATDVVESMVSFTLPANVENLTLRDEDQYGFSVGNISGTGNNLDNWITGNRYDNRIDGKAGADTMVGGEGSDTYVVDDTGDIVTDEGGTADAIESSITITLPEYIIFNQWAGGIENLTLTGSSAIDGTGNKLPNVMTGNSANNVLKGEDGNDTIDGGAGSDTLHGGVGADLLNGGGGADTLYGGDDSDTLDGGAGVDALNGGDGNDTFVVDYVIANGTITFDMITEGATATSGIDTIRLAGASTVDASGAYTYGYVLPDNVENLVLLNGARASGNNLANFITGSSGSDVLDGGAGADVLAGGAGNDRLSGGIGNDTLRGEAGDDTLVYDGVDRLEGGAGNDEYEVYGQPVIPALIVEAAGGGTDRIVVEGSYNLTLLANVENLLIVGAGASDTSSYIGTGDAANNVLETAPGSFNARLEGGAGNDTLIGVNDGDVLVGGAGTDILRGYGPSAGSGAGSDTTYWVDAVGSNGTIELEDTIYEYEESSTPGTGGTDTVRLNGSNISASDLVFTVAPFSFVEDYIFLNWSSSFEAIGSNRPNVLDASSVDEGVSVTLRGGDGADTLIAAGGDDTIDGGSGSDSMVGGLGDDTYYTDAEYGDAIVEAENAGTDTVFANRSYTLGSNLENLTLTGLSQFDGTGNELGNVITGDAGDNTLDGRDGDDTLYGGDGRDDLIGGAGADLLVGGLGDDWYTPDLADTIIELPGEGYDYVYAGFSFALSPGVEVERLELTGNDGVNATGNEFTNLIVGNDANNVIDAGGGEFNILFGGKGNDTLVVRHYTDTVVETAGEGIDTVEASFSFTLPSVLDANGNPVLTTNEELENLRLLTGAYSGTGNELNNIIWGNDQGNMLDGGAGFDVLMGGDGNDTYIVRSLFDQVQEYAFNQFGNAQFLLDGNGNPVRDAHGDYVFQDAGGYNDHIKLQLADPQSITNYFLPDYVEEVTVETSGWQGRINGNDGDNTIRTGSGNDTIDGGAGADRMEGFLGDDTYFVDDAGDQVFDAGGQDLIWSLVSYALPFDVEKLYLSGNADIDGSGNVWANEIRGNSGDNVLDGGAGADTLLGNGGGDIYIVDSPQDAVFESFYDVPVDTVRAFVSMFSLDQFGAQGQTTHIENLTFETGADSTGVGNVLSNVITGNFGNDSLAGGGGNDTIIGAEGNDTLEGDDGYDNLDGGSGDNVLDGGAGNDTLTSGDGDDVLMGGTDNDSLTSGDGDDTLDGGAGYDVLSSGDGNDALQGGSGNDSLTSGGGDDTLDGGTGSDTLDGGAGNDVYFVDSTGDSVVDDANDAGIDVVNASVSFVLPAGVEELRLTGTANVDGTGNALANTITGNGGNNALDGGGGDDTMDGGDGADVISGGDGWDVLDGGSGADTVDGGEGNDTLVYDAADELHGGFGQDTLRVDGEGVTIDLTQDAGSRLTRLEVIDLTGTGGNVVILDGESVSTLSDPGVLQILGTAQDSVIAEGDWQLVFVGGGYHVYDAGVGRIEVQSDISVQIIEPPVAVISVDDLGERGVTLHSAAEDEWYDVSVASAGDLNGDGFGDLVVGVSRAVNPDYSYGGDYEGGSGYAAGTGRAFVVFGKAGGLGDSVSMDAVDGTDGFIVNGQYDGDGLGMSVANAGDLNGDGIDDLVVGAYHAGDNAYSGGDFGRWAREGTSYVLYGKDVDPGDPATGFAATTDADSLKSLKPEGIGAKSGESVAGIGDFNGDGFSDFVISGQYKTQNRGIEGAAYVVFGSPSSAGAAVNLESLDGSNGFEFGDVERWYSSVGYSVSSAGDVNGDGFDDLIVGTERNSGYSFVVFGGSTNPDFLDASKLDGTNGLVLWGGNAVGGGGDINGDGFDDFVVGTGDEGTFVVFGAADMTHMAGLGWYGESNPDQGYGILWGLDSYNGADGTYGFWIAPEGYASGESGGSSGSVVAIAGDLNGDGFDDFVIADPEASPNDVYYAGSVFVVFGGPGFNGNFYLDDLNGRNGFRVDGATPNGELGTSVAAAGDLNGDGFDDLIVGERGAYDYDTESVGQGHAYVIYGTDTGQAGTMGSAAVDTLVAGTDAVVRAGAGDDTIQVDSADFFRIDGGGGSDTLQLTGGMSLDLTTVQPNALEGIERIDLGTGDAGNSLTISTVHARNLLGSGRVLTIDGDGADQLVMIGGIAKADGGDYWIYEFGGIDLHVDKNINSSRVDAPPYFKGASTASVPEGETAVTTVTAVDEHQDPITYAIAGGDDAGKFTINSSNGALNFVTAPDFEAPGDADGDNVYDVIVRASDNDGSDTLRLRVTVTDAVENRAPVFTSGDQVSIDENQSTVVTVATDDPDGDVVTYSITGGADAALLEVDETTGALTFLAAPDFENPADADGDNVYHVTVSAFDGNDASAGNTTVTQDLQVTVTDVFENVVPTFVPPQVLGTSERGTGPFYIEVTDPNPGDGLTISIDPGDDGDKFVVSPNVVPFDGKNYAFFSFGTYQDYENPTDVGGVPGDNVYVLTLRVTDSYGGTSAQTFQVRLSDGNDVPVITSAAVFDAPEEQVAVGTVVVSDQDGDRITYALSGVDAARFTIDTSGALRFVSTPDFENPGDSGGDNVYDLTVTASDNRGGLATQDLTVSVTDVVEPPSSTVIDDAGAEDGVDATIDVSGSFSDPQGGALTYSVSSTAPFLTIHPDTGVITVAPDAAASQGSTGGAYEVTVTATNALGGSTSQSFTLTVVNPAPAFTQSTYEVTAPEGTLADAVVGSVTATDDDAFGYGITAGNDSGLFAIDDQGTIRVTRAIDDADVGSHSLTVTATDAQGDSNTAAVTVELTNVNDAPTSTPIDPTSAADGDTVSLDVGGAFTDADGETLFFGLDNAPAGLSIDASGVIGGTVDAAASQGGTGGVYDLTVTATDPDGESTSQIFALTVTNPEPVFGATSFSYSAAEGAAANASVGSVTATDDDALTYSITAGNDAGLFAIDANGALTVTQAIDDAQVGTYNLTVAIDDGQGGTATTPVTVSLTGVNDAPTIAAAGAPDIANGSFEAPSIGGAPFVTFGPGGSVPGWTIGGNSIDLISSYWPASEGINSVDVSGNAAGSIQQTLATIPGVRYSVTFDFAGHPGAVPTDLQVSAAGETVSYSFTDGNSRSDMGWRAESFTFTATSTSTTLTFTSLEASSSGPAIDNVRLSSSGFGTDEDTSVALQGLSVADVDAGASPVLASLSVAHGNLTLASTAGLSQVTGNGTGALTVSGTVGAINAALGAGLSYTPDANYDGADLLSVTINDQGNGGAGGPQSVSASYDIDVRAVNDAPSTAFSESVEIVNGSFESTYAPGGWFHTYGVGADLGGWTVTKGTVDVDNGLWADADGARSVDMNGNEPGRIQQEIATIDGASYQVSFDVRSNGTLQVSAGGESGLYNSAGDPWTGRTFDFTADGASTDLIFDSISPGGPGGVTLDNVRVTSSDSFFTDEDTARTVTGLRVADVDGGSVQLSLGVGHGELALVNAAGVTLNGDGSDGTLVVSGSLANVNAALSAGLRYTPDGDYNGADTLNVSVNDQANGGVGGALTAAQSIAIGVLPVADTFTASTAHVVDNGSFESTVVAAGWFSTYGNGSNIGGWTVTKGSIDVGELWAAADGSRSVDMNGNEPGRIQQAIDTVAGAKYRVHFDMASNGTLQVVAGDEAGVFTSAGSAWTERSFDFTADGASTTLVFDALSPGGPGGALLDDVEIVRVLENFSLGTGGDVLDLSTLLESAGAPQDGSAFDNGWLEFDTSSGVDTTILFDADGAAGTGFDLVPVLTLIGTVLTEDDTAHYQLG